MEFENRKGSLVPYAKFRIIENGEWKTISTDDFFANKKVIVFSLPGAWTPTCSSSQLPRYEELALAFKEGGIDDIYVLSVNDTFTMNAWLEKEGIQHIKALPDGNGDFTRAMGMEVDKKKLGFGKRSWRYSMFVDNGIISEMFIEPWEEGDPYYVSDADTMMNALMPDFEENTYYVIITKEGCPHCIAAKHFLNHQPTSYKEMVVGKDLSAKMACTLSGKSTYPMIFVNGKCIGGKEDLLASIKP